MEDAQVSGALAEILLLLRPLVDDAVSSLEEDAPVSRWVVAAALHSRAFCWKTLYESKCSMRCVVLACLAD